MDIGCGTGAELELLAKEVGQTVKLIGIDPSLEFVEAARATCSGLTNVEVIHGGGEALSSLLKSPVDGIRVERVLQHVELSIVRQILHQCKIMLKEGGFLVVTEPLWTGKEAFVCVHAILINC